MTAVQLPLTSLADDVAVTRRAIDSLSGPVVLAGHSYGGAVVTEAGRDAGNVTGLVYIATFPLDSGESVGSFLSRYPALPSGADIRQDDDGFLTMAPDKFGLNLAHYADPTEAYFMAAVQHPTHGRCLADTVGAPLWRQKPGWYQVSTSDRMVPVDALRFLAPRAGATTSELPTSHISMASPPGEVADLILAASQAAQRNS